MTPESVVDILRHALLTALWVGAPLLVVGFIAGVLMSLLQIVTSIQTPHSTRFRGCWPFCSR